MENKKKITDYSQAKIYKIVCNKTGLIYIGSTCDTLEMRLKQHEYDCKRYLDKKTNKFISSIFVIYNNDYKMELIENYPCEHKNELHAKENHYITNLECVNMIGHLCNSYERYQRIHARVDMIRNKLGQDAIKILFRYGIEEYKKNKLK